MLKSCRVYKQTVENSIFGLPAISYISTAIALFHLREEAERVRLLVDAVGAN